MLKRLSHLVLLLSAALGVAGASAQAVQISPNAINFGNQPQGSVWSPWTVSVSNTSGTAVTLGQIAVSDPADFSLTNNCPATLNAYSSCNLQVGFTPKSQGPLSTTLNVPNSDLGSPQSIPLNGVGTPGSGASAPVPVFAPTPINFGSQNVGSTSNAWTATLNNQGTAELDITSLVSSDPTDFPITSTDCGSVLPANSTCRIAIAFAPQSAGPISGSLNLTSNAGLLQLPLSGTGVASTGSVQVSPNSVDFGNGTAIGSTSNPWTLNVSNSGGSAVSLTAPAVANPSLFLVTTTCSSTLAAYSSCSISVSFKPQSTTTVNDSITFTAGGVVQSIPLQGSGTSAQASIMISPSSADFGSVLANTPSGTWTFSVNNTSGAPAAFTQLPTISGSSAFVLTGNTCPSTLPAYGSCSFQVTFTPAAAGPYTATITALLQGSATPITASLTGTGLANAPSVQIAPNAINFGSLDVGQTGNPWTVNIANIGSVDVTLNSAVKVIGSNSFTLSSSCGNVIPRYGNCNVQVAFQPRGLGQQSGHILVDIAGGQPVYATLTGNGTGSLPSANVQINPNPYDFGALAAGWNLTATKDFTVTNLGQTDAQFSALPTITGSSDFKITGTTCSTTLPYAGTCTITVQFSPTVVTAETGSLVLTFVDTLTSVTAGLNGTGNQNILTVTPSPVDFGTVAVPVPGSPTLGFDVTRQVTITNNSTVAVALVQGYNSRSNVSGGELNFTPCSTTLQPGQSCTATAQLFATSVGAVTGNLVLFDDNARQVASVPFTATGVQPTYSVNKNSLDFGTVSDYTTSDGQSFTITNTSQVAIPALTFTPSNAVFTVVKSTCGSGIPVGGSCKVAVDFIPTDSTSYNESLAISAGYADQTNVTAIALTGTGTANTNLLTVAPSPVDFGQVAASAGFYGQFLYTRSVTITNNSLKTINISAGYWDGGTGNADVSMSPCSPGILAPGTSCTANVTLSGTAIGSLQQTMSLIDNSYNVVGTISIVGVGVQPTYSFAGQQDFGSVNTNTSVSHTFTFTNTASVPYPAITFSLYTAGFSVSNSTCGAGIPVNGSCSVSVTFAPTLGTDYSAWLQVNNSVFTDPVDQTQVYVYGTGVASVSANYTITGTPIQVPGNSNYYSYSWDASGYFYINNTGTSSLDTSSVATASLVQADPGVFMNTPYSCGVLAPGQSCQVWIEFLGGNAPWGYGGTAQVSVTLAGTTTLIPVQFLIGDHLGDPYTAAPVLSVNAGQSVSVPVGLHIANFTGAVSLSCDGLPAHTFCNFAPSTFTAKGSLNLSSSLTLVTEGYTPGAASVSGNGWRWTLLGMIPVALLGLGMRRRKGLSMASGALLVLLAGISVVTTGCGGAITAPSTPDGSSLITVKATGVDANGKQVVLAKQNFTLSVN